MLKKGCLFLAVLDCLLAVFILCGDKTAGKQMAEVFGAFAGAKTDGYVWLQTELSGNAGDAGNAEYADRETGQQKDTAKRKDGDKPRVALTFDDGPHPVYTDQVLDELDKRDVKGTFFIMGKNIEGNEKVIRRMAREGHLIGNHTFDHVNLERSSKEEICRQLGKTYDELYRLTGQEPIFMRPPFGAWNKDQCCDVDVIPVLWTIDTLDWEHQNASQTLRKVAGRVKDGDIILMHDQYKATVTAVGMVVDYLKDAGFDLVTVDEIVLE